MVELHAHQIDTVFHALSDTTRRQMLSELTLGERTVGQLAEPYAMSLAAASKHIRVLEGAGLVRREIQGRMHICRLEAGPLATAHQWLGFYERFWTDHLDALERLLKEDDARKAAKARTHVKPASKPGNEAWIKTGRRPMNSMNLLEKYGTVSASAEITIQRKLPGPIERIWDYLTDSDLRSQWLASGIMPSTPGGAFELVWRNDELTGQPETRPEGFPEEQRMTSEIVTFEAPHHLAFTWPPRGEVSIELKPVGSDVLLTLVHKRISDRKNMVMVGAGWHMHLDILAAKANGRKPDPFWQGWLRLREEYERLIPE